MSGGSASSLRRRQSVSDSATTENGRERRAALPDYGNPNAWASSASRKRHPLFPPKAELPFQTNIQLAVKKYEGVNEVGAQHLHAIGLLANQTETVRKTAPATTARKLPRCSLSHALRPFQI